MADPVNPTPGLPTPLRPDVTSLQQFDIDLVRALFVELVSHAIRLNKAVMNDGSEGPVVLPSHLKTAMPTAATYIGGLIYVTNEVGGAVPAFSDGTDWRRVTDRAVVS